MDAVWETSIKYSFSLDCHSVEMASFKYIILFALLAVAFAGKLNSSESLHTIRLNPIFKVKNKVKCNCVCLCFIGRISYT